GTWPLNNKFGYNNYSPYKEWKTPWGQRVMVPSNFNITYNDNGDVMMHPEGNTEIPPSAKMGKSGYSFEILDRKQPVADGDPDTEDNLEEFGLLSDKDLEHWRVEVDKAYFSGKAVIASFDGTALGDMAIISGMQLRQPKG